MKDHDVVNAVRHYADKAATREALDKMISAARDEQQLMERELASAECVLSERFDAGDDRSARVFLVDDTHAVVVGLPGGPRRLAFEDVRRDPCAAELLGARIPGRA